MVLQMQVSAQCCLKRACRGCKPLAGCVCSQIVVTCWVGVALHDFWFYAMHTALHRIKWLYKR